MADSISSLSDSELAGMAAGLISAVTAAPATFGLTPAFVTTLTDEKDNFDQELSIHIDRQTQAKAQTIKKDNQRSVLEGLIRDARQMAKAAKISEANMAQMGIPSSSSPAPSNVTVPAAAVNTSERLRHRLDWTDAASLDNKKKPRGVMGAEIWVKIGDPAPGNEKDCVFLTLDAFTPYVAEYDPADAGKTAHYMIRWRMRDGSVSAWGETVSATITG